MSNKKEKETDSKNEVKPVIDARSVLLKINLELLDSSGSVAKVDQSVTLPFIKEPAFAKGAYSQIENTLNVIGVDLFKRMVKQYCLSLVHSYYNEQPPLLNQFNDDKIVVNSPYLENIKNNNENFIPESSDEVIDLDVEEEEKTVD